ncbi:CD225/dispanin family protein [Streptomyces sp. AHU1]|uniref:CD225/dispanin family protein n=1 Tax=Streptomyces sp. AHU1 TaxID=3377215 RepID=UPI00387795B8
MSEKRPPPQENEDWESDTPWEEENTFSESSEQSSHRETWRTGQTGPHQSTVHSGQRPLIQSYMTAAVLVTLFCFLPTGIAAIVFASQVSAKNAAGDLEGAVEASRKARLFVIVSLSVGVAFWLIVILIAAVSGESTAYSSTP